MNKVQTSILLLLITLINVSYSVDQDFDCGDDFCGASYCSSVEATKPRCELTNTVIDWAQEIEDQQCRTCTQSSNAKCLGSTIAAAIAGRTGIKAAYCTETHLVFITDGTTGNTPNLDDVNNPPSGTINGVDCVTGMETLTEEFQQYKIPLEITELSTASSTNNIAAFPGGGFDVTGGYVTNSDGTSYGVPVSSGTGITISGQNLFPIFSNVGVFPGQQCEVDRCNNHVGQGGGQPHQHGSGFGEHCLYDSSDYESTTSGHPPQTGWSNDGYNIYGRHLSTTMDGGSVDLDDCGGHEHGSYEYHYHEEAFEWTTKEPIAPGGTVGEVMTATTNGPKFCYKGDISADSEHWSTDKSALEPCCGMSEYYLYTDLSWDFDVGTPACGSTNCPSERLSSSDSSNSIINSFNLLLLLIIGLMVIV